MKIKPIYNKKIMSKKLNPKELQKIIREALAKNPDLLKEFDDEEDLGIYTDFDATEMHGDALKAAMADITDSGEEFVPLGKSKFEKGMNPEEFTSNIQRAKLNLPKDKEELSKIQKTIDIKKGHEKKFGAGSLNEAPLRNTFDTKNLYSFLKDAMFAFMEGDGSSLNYAEAAKFIEQELLKVFDINKKFKIPVGLNQEGNVNPNSKIDRPKDAEGQPITLRARVEDQETGAVGHVVRFGIDDDGKQTVHIDWMQNFGGIIPKSIVHPTSIVVRDETRIVREDEENGEAYPENNRYMFFGNLQQIQRQAGLMLDMNEEKVNEILESGHDWAQDHIATAKESMDQVFDFLMNETKKESEVEVEADLEESSIRSHANGRGQNKKPGNFPQTLKRVGMNENFDYAAAEREPAGQEELAYLANKAEQIVPENLIKFLELNSFNSNDTEYSYLLKIPKQPDETLKDIELFVKEEIGIDKPISLYTELEKITNKWVISVKVLK